MVKKKWESKPSSFTCHLSYSKLGTRWRTNVGALICHFLAVQSFLPTVYRIVALVHVLRFVWYRKKMISWSLCHDSYIILRKCIITALELALYTGRGLSKELVLVLQVTSTENFLAFCLELDNMLTVAQRHKTRNTNQRLQMNLFAYFSRNMLLRHPNFPWFCPWRTTATRNNK